MKKKIMFSLGRVRAGLSGGASIGLRPPETGAVQMIVNSAAIC